MKAKLTRLFSILAATMLGLLLIASPALAIDFPQNLQISSVYVFQHLLEPNDQLYLVEYFVDYDDADPFTDDNPTENITEAYLGRLMDGIDELGAVAPYAYYDEGYDKGIFAIYFSASDPNLPTWNGAYTMKLMGNPTLTWLGSTASTAMGGAVAYDVPAYTDETTEANDAAANDMTLLPATPVVNDAYYFGDVSKFSLLKINIDTNGEWLGTYGWEYWNGQNWMIIDDLVDGTNGFTAGIGTHTVIFTIPGNWAKTTVSSMELYWIRLRVVTYTDITTQPKGTQSWTNSTSTTPPSTTTSAFDLWSSSTSIPNTQNELTARILYIANQLEQAWDINMVDSTSTGTYLSSEGEEYFANVISSIRAMAPGAFAGGTIQPEWDYKEGTTGYADDRADSVIDTPLDLTPMADWWDISRMWTSSILFLGGSILILYSILSPTGSFRPLILLSTPLIIAGGYLGLLPLMATVLIGLAAFVLTIFTLFYHPSSV